MSRTYKLNKKGKVAASILAFLMLYICFSLGSMVIGQKQEATEKNQIVHEAASYEEKTPFLKSSQIIENNSMEEESADTSVSQESEKVVYLTFDDGPHSTISEEIVNLLNHYDAKATFFMLKPNIENNSTIVRKMVESGHAVGAHGITHDVAQVYKSPEDFAREMKETLDLIREITDQETRLIRAPFGSFPYITDPYKAVIEREQHILWDWNIDSEDWKLTNGEFVEHVINQVNNISKKPLVVLMHEKATTVAHLEKLLSYFQDNGYEMRAIDEAVEPVQFY
ncbi:polysaccharide deacetylase [Alkalihalobacillus oceani]|uniref:polysaccharide deacetylase family protein n=1 Tax=Halalkalibacter oceani TaxID=1653776 RepID=UPI00203CE8A2|nr:polysaccharide deacetylase family protein [Halalkalibacter oceani]MCM3760873.1 polysaccharide deacetylase [Halalkalibacter oceani]